MSQSNPSDMSIKDISKLMAEEDIAMLITRHGDDPAIRPMSNNKDVEFDGDTFFFTTDDTTTVSDIRTHDRVGVSYQNKGEETFISLSGSAKLHTDKDVLKKHWKESLSKWFENGLDTDGLTLIEVNAERVHYWIGRDEGSFDLD